MHGILSKLISNMELICSIIYPYFLNLRVENFNLNFQLRNITFENK